MKFKKSSFLLLQIFLLLGQLYSEKQFGFGLKSEWIYYSKSVKEISNMHRLGVYPCFSVELTKNRFAFNLSGGLGATPYYVKFDSNVRYAATIVPLNYGAGFGYKIYTNNRIQTGCKVFSEFTMFFVNPIRPPRILVKVNAEAEWNFTFNFKHSFLGFSVAYSRLQFYLPARLEIIEEQHFKNTVALGTSLGIKGKKSGKEVVKISFKYNSGIIVDLRFLI